MSLDSWHSMHFPDEPFEYDRSLSADWVPVGSYDRTMDERVNQMKEAADIFTAPKHPATIGTSLRLTANDCEYLEQFGLESDRLLSLFDKGVTNG